MDDRTAAYICRGLTCAVCGWVPRFPNMIERHHLLPRAAGGGDEWANTVLLCPNHHRLAHAMFQCLRGHWNGPSTRDELIAALADPDAYYEQARAHIRSLLR